MIQKIFTIYDNKAQAFLQPFFTRNENTAIRMVSQILQNAEHEFTRHMADYELYALGEYDDNSGKIETIPPTHVININQIPAMSADQAPENWPGEAPTLKEA